MKQISYIDLLYGVSLMGESAASSLSPLALGLIVHLALPSSCEHIEVRSDVQCYGLEPSRASNQ